MLASGFEVQGFEFRVFDVDSCAHVGKYQLQLPLGLVLRAALWVVGVTSSPEGLLVLTCRNGHPSQKFPSARGAVWSCPFC